jgi:hypothetical protein
MAVRRLVCIAMCSVLFPATAQAYRPFDSTDPAVPDRRNVEVELSPVSFRRAEGSETWIGPSVRLNYGFAQDWEVVLEGQAEHSGGGHSALVEDALSLKTVLREGNLQDKEGISIATEAALLLPGINDEHGRGFGLTGIAGERWSWGAVHVNAGAGLSREHRGEFTLGSILEGPDHWEVSPVAEITYDREMGIREEYAALVGVIWQASAKLAFDLAVRRAAVNGSPETELRAGVSFAFSAGL